MTAVGDAGDPRLRMYTSMRDPELARRHGLFVAEGRLVVERLVAARSHRLESILVTEAAARAMAHSLEMVPPEVPIYLASATVVEQVAGFHVHRGCVALASRGAAPDAVRALVDARTVVVLESVANPDNVGGTFRTAWALGADAVMLSEQCADPLYRKAVRTSMGAVFLMPYAYYASWPTLAETLRRGGFVLAALTPSPAAVPLAQLARRDRRTRRIALLVGSEGHGLSHALENDADVRVRIPMRPGVDSLNLTAAIAVALSHLRPDPDRH